MDRFIYKLLDKKGNLLYVGNSSNIEKRVNEHRTQQSWGKDINTILYRKAEGNSYIDESQTILNCIPIHNIQHNPNKDMSIFENTAFEEWSPPKRMTDTSIAQRFSMPLRTLAHWKIAPSDNWRRKLYLFMKATLEVEQHSKFDEASGD